MKKNLKQNKAITLVALVITIIILLILATITIIELKNTNLFSKTIEAKNKYKQSAEEENNILDDYANKINDIAGGMTTQIENTQTKSDKIYLYDYGNECQSITGGWESQSWGIGYGATKETNRIACYAQNVGNGVTSNNKIDLSEYKKLKWIADVATYSNVQIKDQKQANTGNCIRGVYKEKEMDISDLNESYYISLIGYGYGYNYYYQVWLEK